MNDAPGAATFRTPAEAYDGHIGRWTRDAEQAISPAGITRGIALHGSDRFRRSACPRSTSTASGSTTSSTAAASPSPCPWLVGGHDELGLRGSRSGRVLPGAGLRPAGTLAQRAADTAGGVDEDGDDFAALLEALDLAPAHVVTNSGGGNIALRLAGRRPDLFRSLSCHEPPVWSLLESDSEEPRDIAARRRQS